MCISAEIKPPPVRVSPSPNRYLSQHLQKLPPTTEIRPQCKKQNFICKRKRITSANLKKKQGGIKLEFLKYARCT